MNSKCDVLIVGGGTGACAAALALSESGLTVTLTEPTDWIGGQLTSQAVPPDEHPWIETCGCTASYRKFRNRVRQYYQVHLALNSQAELNPELNPGGGWVSRLCHEPVIAWKVLNSMVAEAWNPVNLEIRLRTIPISVSGKDEKLQSIEFLNVESGEKSIIEFRFVLDATELGELLHLANIEHRTGAESMKQTGELHAVKGEPDPENVQGVTWCFAMGFDPENDHTIPKPKNYDFWSQLSPPNWAGKLLSWNTLHAHTGEFFTWTLFASEHERGMGLFDYRQIISKKVLNEPNLFDTTVVNWPQNDYYVSSTLIPDSKALEARFEESKQLSLSLLYWLQTEAPRPDCNTGYPGLFLNGEPLGTSDGFAKAPYIRESRRIEALFTVLEEHVSAHDNPGQNKARQFWDTVGIGAYRIDLHPSTSGAPTIDFSSLPFQIPLGSLIPVRITNLLPACKNLGVTHITNGCYRLHPVEWNIGEAAAVLAAYCLENGCTPQQVYASKQRVAEVQSRLINLGVELEWQVGFAL